ncbi:unnamed protein product [Vicia faba]|uniref:Uncharacterized protein n=1 Tax=Vicia faba TaxID=3906 RepID=A0AAV1B5P6_VICFA|nr:unnamed protein product [Vicia faba]
MGFCSLYLFVNMTHPVTFDTKERFSVIFHKLLYQFSNEASYDELALLPSSFPHSKLHISPLPLSFQGLVLRSPSQLKISEHCFLSVMKTMIEIDDLNFFNNPWRILNRNSYKDVGLR